jgi:O-antigen/teichoic acid export membrane protein
MRPAGLAYALGASGVALSTAAATGSGFLSLLLLTRILTKEMFGAYAFAMAVVALASFVATLGLDRALLLRVARRPARADRLQGSGIALRASLAAALAGAAVAAAIAWGGVTLAGEALPREAGFWFPALALAVIPMSISMMLQAWFQANHRVAVSTSVPGLSDLVRCLLLALVFLLGLGAAGVAGAVLVAAAVPVLVLLALAWGRSVRQPRLLVLADFGKGLQFLTLRLATQGMRQADLIMMGLLATAAGTADYALAVRLAALADYGRQSLKPSFTPRARRWLATGDRLAALREYEQTRNASLAVALLAAAGFAALGPSLLGVFGNFESAYPPLLLLSASFIVNAGFGMHSSYLAMQGEVSWSAAIRMVALVALIVLHLVLIPRFGAMGAAAAALVVQIAVNIFGALLAYRLTGLVAVDRVLLLVMAAAGAALALVALDAAPQAAGVAVLALTLAVVLFRSRELIVGQGARLGARMMAMRVRSGPR